LAKDKQRFEALSETAEKNMEIARGAMDSYFSFLQNAMLPDAPTLNAMTLKEFKHY
jgi:hypothetical protein